MFLEGFDPAAFDTDGNATLEHDNGDHEPIVVLWKLLDDAGDAGERPGNDAHTPALCKKRPRDGCQPGTDYSPDGGHLGFVDR
jgi:hypothetical protein